MCVCIGSEKGVFCVLVNNAHVNICKSRVVDMKYMMSAIKEMVRQYHTRSIKVEYDKGAR